MTFEEDHAAALEAMRESGGVEITFPALSGGTYNAATGTWTAVASGTPAVTGAASEKTAAPEEYQKLSQIVASPVLLLFIPNEYGARPVTGQTPVWAGKARTVARVFPIRPGGEAIGAQVVLG